MKTADDFKRAAAEKHIHRWTIHNCSICEAGVGFNIMGDYVEFDSSCACAWSNPRPSSWEEVADTYNRNVGASNVAQRIAKHPTFKQYVDDTNVFWGFVSE